jgi:hypothetical protein
MKVLSVVLWVLTFACISAGQKMTDRDVDRLAGKVKTVQVWTQKVRPDGTPVEEARTISESTYDEEGNIAETIAYGPGQLKTTYFLVKGERVSKSEWVGEDPTTKMTVPKGVKLEKRKNVPFEFKYKYTYDKDGRIAEIGRQDVERKFQSTVKYGYDDNGRIVSATDRSGWNLVNEIVNSFKYDDKGNVAEVVSKSTLHLLKGTGKNFAGPPYVAVEKEESTVRYSDHTFDKNGNWVKRTSTCLNSQGKITSLFVLVRYFDYF